MRKQITGEGMWLLDKPVGISSFGLVAQVRRLTGIRKVGHAGTLDPLASGLMIVLVGKDFTRQAQQYVKLDKTYEVEMTLGQTSTTGDGEGEKTAIDSREPTEQELADALAAFVGEIEQTPPAYSAIKIGGQPAYKLARKGQAVEIAPRKVTISDITLTDYQYPIVKFRCDVSSGTYVRSLVEDIGTKLGTGAYMSNLRRTRIGQYRIDDALVLE
ncbi:tRNA pseudouridine(55) synthase TruB [bacterium]|nr:tRNA pseudouridine(55) synthase TruB [bacterium]